MAYLCSLDSCVAWLLFLLLIPHHALKWVKLDTYRRRLTLSDAGRLAGYTAICPQACACWGAGCDVRCTRDCPAANFFSDPHISRPPDFQSKNLSKIFRLMREYIRYLLLLLLLLFTFNFLRCQFVQCYCRISRVHKMNFWELMVFPSPNKVHQSSDLQQERSDYSNVWHTFYSDSSSMKEICQAKKNHEFYLQLQIFAML